MRPGVIYPARVDYSQALCVTDLENKFQLNTLKTLRRGGAEVKRAELQAALKINSSNLRPAAEEEKSVPCVPSQRAGCGG